MTWLNPIQPGLSPEQIIADGREAWAQLREGSEDWLRWKKTGRLLVLIDDQAQVRGGNSAHRFRQAKGELLIKYELDDKHIDKGVRSRLIAIMRREQDVENWLAGIDKEVRREWTHPNTVHRHCPFFRKARPASGTPKAPGLREVNRTLQQEKHALEQRLKRNSGGDNIDFEHDTDAHIIDMLAHGLVTRERILRIARGLQTKASEMAKRAAAASPADAGKPGTVKRGVLR